MAQYAEGQRLKGSDGNIYVVRNGTPVRDTAPLVANPMQPLDVQSKQLGNQRTQQEIDQANATAAANTRRANAEATSAEIAARQAQEQYKSQHPTVDTSGLYGADYLKTLSSSDQNMVKALAEGRLAFPNGSALRAPFWQEKLNQVAQFDPTFDATNYNARAKGREAAITGQLSKSNNALNTAMGHLGTLFSQIDGTASHGGFPLATTVNALQNAYEKGAGDPGVTNFMDTAQKLADELETAYRGSGGAEAGVVRQLQSLSPNASRDQKIGVIRNAMDLLASKMAANISQYNFGTGGKPTWNMLDQHTLDVLNTPAFQDIRDKYFAAPAAVGGGGGNGPGGIDRTNNGGTSPILPGGTTRSEPDQQANAFIDSLVASNTPYRQALGRFQRQFPGAAPFSPGQYEAALSYHAKHPNEAGGYGAVTRTVPLSDGQAFANGLVQSAPGALVTRANNALLGGLPAALAGDQGAYFNALTNQAQPLASGLGDFAGAVGGTIGIGKGLKALGPALSNFSPAVSRALANPAIRGATADTLYGGAFGATQNPDNRVGGALLGAGSMLGGNAVGQLVVGPGLAAAGNSRLGQRALGMFGQSAAPALAAPDKLLVQQAGNNTDQIFNNLNDAANLNLPYSLADANPQLRVLAGSAVRKSPAVRQLAEDTIAPRQLGQADRAIAAINENLAPTADLSQISSDALTRAQAASRPLYEKAMQAPSPVDAKLTDMMNTPAGQNAAREAYAIALNKGENPGDLSFHQLDNGSVVVDGNPNWRTLQYMKQGVDSVVERARDQATGKLNLKDPSVRGLNDFRNQFTNRLHVLNPDLAAADNAFANFARQGTAANMGAAATSRMVTPDAVAGIVANTAPEHLPFYQQGFASSLANKVDNAPFSSDPYRLIYGSPAQQAKIGTVFPQGAPTFGRINSLESDMGKTAYETLGGSPTAARAQADAAFDGGLGGPAADMAFALATGAPPPSLIQRGLRMANDTFRMGLGQKKAEQIGPVLLDQNPAQAAEYLRNLTDLAAARREYMARARAAGGMFAAPLAAPLIAN